MTLRLNWKVQVECLDCKADFTVERVDPSQEIIGDGNRAILIWVPNACPSCHNLRIVEEPKG